MKKRRQLLNIASKERPFV